MTEETGKRTRSPDDFLSFDAEAERGPEKAARLEGEEARRTSTGRPAELTVHEDNVGADFCVRGLAWGTDEERLKRFMSRFGVLSTCEVKREPDGRSRGFGFVNFESFATARSYHEFVTGPHELDGRLLEILPPRAKASVEETRKLFVGSLPPGASSEDVRRYFEQYGEIEEIYMPQGSGKDFSFVTFKEQAAARAALMQCEAGGHQINGRPVSVKLPTEKKPSFQRAMGGGMGGGGMGMGGGMGPPMGGMGGRFGGPGYGRGGPDWGYGGPMRGDFGFPGRGGGGYGDWRRGPMGGPDGYGGGMVPGGRGAFGPGGGGGFGGDGGGFGDGGDFGYGGGGMGGMGMGMGGGMGGMGMGGMGGMGGYGMGGMGGGYGDMMGGMGGGWDGMGGGGMGGMGMGGGDDGYGGMGGGMGGMMGGPGFAPGSGGMAPRSFNNRPGAGPPVSGYIPGCTLNISNLAWEVTWQELKDLFKQFGTVAFAEIHKGPDGRSMGRGQIRFLNPDDAARARGALDQHVVRDRAIKVLEGM